MYHSHSALVFHKSRLNPSLTVRKIAHERVAPLLPELVKVALTRDCNTAVHYRSERDTSATPLFKMLVETLMRHSSAKLDEKKDHGGD